MHCSRQIQIDGRVPGTERSPTALAAPIRDVALDIEPDVTLFDVTTLGGVVAVMTAPGGVPPDA